MKDTVETRGVSLYLFTNKTDKLDRDALRELRGLRQALNRADVRATVKVYDPQGLSAAKAASIANLLPAPTWTGIGAWASRMTYHDPWDGKPIQATVSGCRYEDPALKPLPITLTDRVPTSRELAADIAETIRLAPKEHFIVFVYQGHGSAYSMADLPQETILEAYGQVQVKGAVELRDSCNQAELGILKNLSQQGIKIAFVSSPPLYTNRLYYEDLFPLLAEPGPAKEKAIKLIEQTGKKGRPEMFAAVDLQEIENLWQSMEVLIETLRYLEGNPEKMLQNAYVHARPKPNCWTRLQDFCDLEVFLNDLEKNASSAETDAAILDARLHLQAAIIAKTNREKAPYNTLSPLSLHWRTIRQLYPGIQDPPRDPDPVPSWSASVIRIFFSKGL